MSRRATAHVIAISSFLAALGAVSRSNTTALAILVWTIVATVAIARLAIREQPDHPSLLPWLAWISGLMTTGTVIRAIHGFQVDNPFPMPSPADIIHFPAYCLFLAMLIKVHRHRANRRDVDAWLDGGMVALAAALVVWTTFYGDFVQDERIPAATRLLNAPFDVVVVVSMVLLLRISAEPGPRPTAYKLLGAACLSLATIDVMAGFSLAVGTGLQITIALSPIAYGLTLAAAAHPSARLLLTRQVEAELEVRSFRITLIATAIMAPLLTIIYPPNSSLDTGVTIALASLLSIVVTIRIARLLLQQQRRTKLEQRLSKESTALASLAEGANVEQYLVDAIRRIVPHAQVWICSDDSISVADTIPGSSSPYPGVRHSRNGMSPSEWRAMEQFYMNFSLIMDVRLERRLMAERELERLAAQRVAASERRFRSLVQNASDIFIVLNHAGEATYASDAILRVLGYEPEFLLGKQLNSIVHENDREPAARQFLSIRDGSKSQESHEFRAYTADGEVRLLEAIMTDMTSVPEVAGIVVNATDVTANRSLERDLKDAETIDPLTLQLNRKAFIQEVDTALRRASISGAAVSIAIIDLDDFKTLNDALGPVLADQALVEAANRIRRTVRLGDVVARLSGDEFGVLMPDGYSSLESVAAIERVLDELSMPFELDRHPLSLTATAGMGLDIGGKLTASILLREADTALGTAKKTAPGKAVMFEEEMGSAVTERLDLRTGFERALQNEEMRLVYQPILDMRTGRIVSLEALARWEHPDRGPISPSIFIPIAEDSNTITPLGEWALRTACRQVNEWSRRGLTGFTVSVNMSGQTLIEDNVISRVRSILEATEVDPARIIIEITETVLIDDTQFIADRISALRSLGVALAIDDFGTGYSSLSYLQRYEFDYLKIDRAFVRPLEAPENVKEREIVAAIIQLANGLGATTVAEGIEGESEHLVLQTLNCDRAQGFLFHRPKEVNEIFEILCEDLALDVAA